MMNGPFFRSQHPSRSVPFQQTPLRSSSKVVSVPVHFVSSDQPPATLSTLKSSAAVKIQKLFRGFLVRKSVKKIASIRGEVSEIERRIDDVQVVDLIRRDAKERLRVNETLMSLLFKLDSIRGVDCGVRELRKAVTRKAIALQEKVDSIAKADDQTIDSPNTDSDSAEIQLDNVCTSTSEHVTETSDFPDAVVDDSAEGGEDGGVIKEVVKEVVEDCNPGCGIEEGSPTEDLTEDGKERDEGSRDLLVKLMADNEKMMKLMMQISERNEMQTRMINSLSRRVEQLEKAFTSENPRRKKKARVALRRRDGISN